MSVNPYEAPNEQSTSESPPVPSNFTTTIEGAYVYQSQERTVKWLLRLFVFIGIARTMLVTIDLLNATTRWPDNSWIQVGTMAYAPFWVAYTALAFTLIPVFLVTVFVYGSWIRRANRNARALGAEDMAFTPGWAFGWFFIPFLNLVRPYQAVRELYQTSAPIAGATGWKTLPASLIGWWWMTWILANLTSNIESRLFRETAESETVITMESWFGVVTGTLWVAATYLAFKVVKSITLRQENKRKAGLQT